MSITADQLQQLTESSSVYNRSDKIGKVGQIYLDDQSGEPTWVTVKTGLFGTGETFVPLQRAQLDGDDLRVDYDEDTIKGAPRVEADGQISPEEEDELYRYYGINDGPDLPHEPASDAGQDTTSATAGAGMADDPDRGPEHGVAVGGIGDRDDDHLVGEDGTVGRDMSGPTTDHAMTRSEERLTVGTATREAGKARLRKYVTTEQVTQTVPVRHEQVTLEREPITEADQVVAGRGPEISEEEHEVTLHEEVPVVDKDVVAVERVKLGTETVTEDATVTDEVRKENIDMVEPQDPERA